MVSFVGEALTPSGPLPPSDYPEIKRWAAGLSQRPAYKQAEEKGGKVDFDRFTR